MHLFDDETSESEEYDFEGECLGCDTWGPVNDLGFCDECNEKFERDLIRQRQWEYSAMAFGAPPEKLEELRQLIIAQYGEALEILAPPGPDQ